MNEWIWHALTSERCTVLKIIRVQKDVNTSPDGRLIICLGIWGVWSMSWIFVADHSKSAFSKPPLNVLILDVVLGWKDPEWSRCHYFDHKVSPNCLEQECARQRWGMWKTPGLSLPQALPYACVEHMLVPGLFLAILRWWPCPPPSILFIFYFLSPAQFNVLRHYINPYLVMFKVRCSLANFKLSWCGKHSDIRWMCQVGTWRGSSGQALWGSGCWQFQQTGF